MRQGIVVEFNKRERSYEVRVDSQTAVNLPIEECGSTKFKPGDIIDFELATTKNYGSYVKDPVLSHNVHLSYLESIAGTEVTIEAKIIAVKQNIYQVSYYGYLCYMSIRQEIIDKLPKAELDSLASELNNFKVKEVRNGFVHLSKHYKITELLQQLKQKELESLTEGSCFDGIVVRRCGYGAYVRNKFTEGLLHVSNIIDDYHIKQINPKELDTLVKQRISKGERLNVIIERIYDSKYSLKILQA